MTGSLVACSIFGIYLGGYYITEDTKKARKNDNNGYIQVTRTQILGSLPPSVVVRQTQTPVKSIRSQIFNIWFLPTEKLPLGNIMFLYASLYGIAQTNSMLLLLYYNHTLTKIFHPEAVLVKQIRPGGHQVNKVYEKTCCIFKSSVTKLPQQNTELMGYFQSWKYFFNASNDIRRQFRPRNEVDKAAFSFVQSKKDKYYKNITSTVIGIHIRRGEAVWPDALSHGYTDTNITYIATGMQYFKNKMSNVLFIACSDDRSWMYKNLKMKDITFCTAKSAEEDLAILGHCDHTIITQGTFGWWAGWLAQGQVVYPATWPRPNSPLAHSLNPADYFMPTWIAL